MARAGSLAPGGRRARMKQYLPLAYGLTHGSPGWDRRELAGLARLCSRARFTGHGDGDGLASSPARGRLRGRKARQARVSVRGVSAPLPSHSSARSRASLKEAGAREAYDTRS
jgi:hypothetical protein